MHEPNLLPTDRETRRRRGAIVALLAAGVLAVGVGGWLLLASALGSFSDSLRPASPTRPSNESASSKAPRAAAASGTTRLQLTPEGEISVSSSYSFGKAVDQIWLTVPEQSDASSAQSFDPSITRMRVSVPGRPERRISGQLVVGSRIGVPVPADATEVKFDYVVDGVVVPSIPSSRGRAVALLTPLEVRFNAQTLTTVIVEDSGVIGLGCEVDGSAMTACGSQADGGWQVTVDSAKGETRIVAAVNLAQP
jgi:hypothetical protein